MALLAIHRPTPYRFFHLTQKIPFLSPNHDTLTTAVMAASSPAALKRRFCRCAARSSTCVCCTSA